jgi:hypothetical protein
MCSYYYHLFKEPLYDDSEEEDLTAKEILKRYEEKQYHPEEDN